MFEHNNKISKRKIFFFTLLFLIGSTCTVFLTSLAFSAIFYANDLNLSIILQGPIFKYANIILIGMILYQAEEEFSKLRQNSAYLPACLSARVIAKNTQDFKQQRFLNILEELSIAFGLKIPKAYLLKDETINAFVCGYDKDQSVICITKGALEKLNRDELQGVIAHEFSNILNANVKANIIISSLIYGMVYPAVLGRELLRAGQVIFGGILFISGAIGLFIGLLTKSALSKQKKYLSDANAKHFIRYNLGLANALKKIKKHGDKIDFKKWQLYDHFYLTNESTSAPFNTHPSIEKRIKILET